ncbi:MULTISPECIES: ABC transporter ATP-binding protein [Halorubrum]|uniref:ABC-type D-xylose/L-arabinose transporter n=2 Tax=Halorubrum TaxID=56688 RepID=A0A1I6HA77_HALSD|nr:MULTISPECIES: ABC transporter ATP-binding protein [Halorubrum]TKX55835.1 ABC transporter ATP-binding protein [Halorubrum sp. SP3]TKX71383.1 ABC transporter ATP-binding protein [Halorubrum sp. SP9]SFR51362.1 carbohydrate ABC transporter ATP-binding protein, CUT1 family (TC 3.A.1.1.-) [Halorubrum sodomense]
MSRVKLTDVTKQYDDVTAVDNMNLDLNDGEFICLVGPSGCGKSTTLETIAGLTKPTSGEILIGDREVTNLPPKDRGIAMVFQNIALFPHMDVYDNISFGLRLRSFPQDEMDERVEEAARIVRMEGMLDRMPSEMSGGQRQRVAIARAIVRDPEVFLMDEPLANLDAKLRVNMRTELQRLHKQLDTTIIYVTHNQAEAMTMSDRIAVLNKGELQQIAPPLTCYNQPANRFVAGFIGSPSMNFFDATVGDDTLDANGYSISFDATAIDGVASGDAVDVGIRPEDLYLTTNSAEARDPSATFAVETDVLEPMGDEIFVYLKPILDPDDGGEAADFEERQGLLMSVDPATDIGEDEDVEIVFDRAQIHLFDDRTGDAISHGVVADANVEAVDDGVQAD